MKPLSVVLITFALLCACRCSINSKRVTGNGNIQSDDRVVRNATKIKLLGDMDIYLDSGATSIRVEADENLLPYLQTVLDDDWLEIKMKRGLSYSTKNAMKIYITTPTITHIKSAGSGNVSSETKFWSKNAIEFDITGSGDINIDVNTPRVDADISGSGNLNIAGETRDIDVSIAGSGNYKGLDLKAENANIKISGSGDAMVFADVKIKAKIVGSGDVKYKGNATLEKKIVGSGTVQMQ